MSEDGPAPIASSVSIWEWNSGCMGTRIIVGYEMGLPMVVIIGFMFGWRDARWACPW